MVTIVGTSLPNQWSLTNRGNDVAIRNRPTGPASAGAVIEVVDALLRDVVNQKGIHLSPAFHAYVASLLRVAGCEIFNVRRVGDGLTAGLHFDAIYIGNGVPISLGKLCDVTVENTVVHDCDCSPLYITTENEGGGARFGTVTIRGFRYANCADEAKIYAKGPNDIIDKLQIIDWPAGQRLTLGGLGTIRAVTLVNTRAQDIGIAPGLRCAPLVDATRTPAPAPTTSPADLAARIAAAEGALKALGGRMDNTEAALAAIPRAWVAAAKTTVELTPKQ